MYVITSSYSTNRESTVNRTLKLRMKLMKLIVLFVLISLVTAFAAFAHAYAGSKQVEQGNKQDLIASIVHPTAMTAHFVEVESGDTLWDIARVHKKKSDDIHSFIYKIKKVNHLKSSVLKLGQILILPS